MDRCDYCSEPKETLHLTNEFTQICDECLEECDPSLKLVDPDADYDRHREDQLLASLEAEHDN